MALVFAWQWLLILAGLTFWPSKHGLALLPVTVALTLMVHREQAELPAPSRLGWGLLAGFVFFLLLIPGCRLRTGEQGRLSACKANLHGLGTALTLYSNDQRSLPPHLEALTPNYLKSIPTCPAAGKPNYVYRRRAEGFMVYCRGCYHHCSIDSANYPRFDSQEGFHERPSSQAPDAAP